MKEHKALSEGVGLVTEARRGQGRAQAQQLQGRPGGGREEGGPPQAGQRRVVEDAHPGAQTLVVPPPAQEAAGPRRPPHTHGLADSAGERDADARVEANGRLHRAEAEKRLHLLAPALPGWVLGHHGRHLEPGKRERGQNGGAHEAAARLVRWHRGVKGVGSRAAGQSAPAELHDHAAGGGSGAEDGRRGPVAIGSAVQQDVARRRDDQKG